METPMGVEAVEEMIYPYETIPTYQPVNRFKNNSKIKPEEKPDKKAVYSGGTGQLLDQISSQLLVPYHYTVADRYVIIRFVVGKDSMLYNPEILYTPGADYSINASNAIESLQDKFLPATKNGKPVDSILIIPVRFGRKSNPYGEG
jgi:hypothetical protein